MSAIVAERRYVRAHYLTKWVSRIIGELADFGLRRRDAAR